MPTFLTTQHAAQYTSVPAPTCSIYGHLGLDELDEGKRTYPNKGQNQAVQERHVY